MPGRNTPHLMFCIYPLQFLFCVYKPPQQPEDFRLHIALILHAALAIIFHTTQIFITTAKMFKYHNKIILPKEK
jgi:hypothetical protein